MSSREIYFDLERAIESNGLEALRHMRAEGMLITFKGPTDAAFGRNNLEVLVRGREVAAARWAAPRDYPEAWACFIGKGVMLRYEVNGIVKGERYPFEDGSIRISVSPDDISTAKDLLIDNGEVQAEYGADEALNYFLEEVNFPRRGINYNPFGRVWSEIGTGEEIARGKSAITIDSITYSVRRGKNLSVALWRLGQVLKASFPYALTPEQASGIQTMVKTPTFEWMKLPERFPVAINPRAEGSTPEEEGPKKQLPPDSQWIKDLEKALLPGSF